jgi:hypothetical protein
VVLRGDIGLVRMVRGHEVLERIKMQKIPRRASLLPRVQTQVSITVW